MCEPEVLDLQGLAEAAVHASVAQAEAMDRLTRTAFQAGVPAEGLANCYAAAADRLGVALAPRAPRVGCLMLLLVSLALVPAPVFAASKEGCGGECKCPPPAPKPAPKKPKKDLLRPDFKIGPQDLPKPTASVVAPVEVRHA